MLIVEEVLNELCCSFFSVKSEVQLAAEDTKAVSYVSRLPGGEGCTPMHESNIVLQKPECHKQNQRATTRCAGVKATGTQTLCGRKS